MAAIAHAAVFNTAQEVNSGAYADVSGMSLASTNFTVGAKYLLWVQGTVTHSSSNRQPGVRVLHGSTVFTASQHEKFCAASESDFPYHWFTVWTAVAGEAITVQLGRITGSGGSTAGIDNSFLFAMRLDVDLVENVDWFFSEDATDEALTASLTTGASITFTPLNSSDWLVVGNCYVDVATTANHIITSIYGSTIVSPYGQSKPTNTADLIIFTSARVVNLPASSITWTEQSLGDTNTRLHSSIFAINLNKFKEHAFAWTEGSAAIVQTPDFGTQLQTVGITLSVASDLFLGAVNVLSQANSGQFVNYRMQLNDVDAPDTQTSDHTNYTFSFDDTNQGLYMTSHLSIAAAAQAHTIDTDGDGTTTTHEMRHRLIWAFTMELAPSAFPFKNNPMRSLIVR